RWRVVYVSSRLSGTRVTTPALARSVATSTNASDARPVPAPCTNTTPGRSSPAPTGSRRRPPTVAPSRRIVTSVSRTSNVPTGSAPPGGWPPIVVSEVAGSRCSVTGTGSHCGPVTAPTIARTIASAAVVAAVRKITEESYAARRARIPGAGPTPARGTSPVSEPEPVQLLRVALPVLGDLDVQVEVHARAEQRLDALAGPGADV